MQALAVTCAQAGFDDGTLGPDEQEALAQLGQSPGPFPGGAEHLRRLDADELAPIPSSLPKELREFLGELHTAIRRSAEFFIHCDFELGPQR